MHKVLEYRRVAEECRKKAVRITNQNHKKALEDTARAWEKIAQDRERLVMKKQTTIRLTQLPPP
jgi:hypothetical protein